MFDVLVIGGGVAGMQCALILGSAKSKEFAKDKKIGIIAHQKASHLQSAELNNAIGIAPGTSGLDLLNASKKHLADLYPHVLQIENEKVLKVEKDLNHFTIFTNKNRYTSKLIVVALGYTNFFNIEGLNQYLEPHELSNREKERVQLKNTNHLVAEGIYVAGTLAGWRSQFAIAAGSGAQVATDILTLWNNGKHAHVHDKLV
ncbi:FAD-dependent oxidoreductase [Zhouia amylolytica]|uniref:Thioredoxin reductase n=1 Tax=Zhouia amylolytica AD3 TaxID=1286632 RepID=W2UJD1_9FLAO|nr:FAD-dependent oxidoreductase [Zhouia amylolytica]ETN94245.1 thioredoxin reductase [Zhouia amylolytica AD3]